MSLKMMLARRLQAMSDKVGVTVLWRRAESLEDAGVLIAGWLRGDVLYTPTYGALSPDPETVEASGFAEAMARVCELGVVTLCSQPGIPDLQEEFVDLITEDRHVSLISRVARQVGIEVEVSPERRPSLKDIREGRFHRPWSRKDAAHDLRLGSRKLASKVAKGSFTPLALYDGEFGRRGRVQEVLDQLADSLGETPHAPNDSNATISGG